MKRYQDTRSHDAFRRRQLGAGGGSQSNPWIWTSPSLFSGFGQRHWSCKRSGTTYLQGSKYGFDISEDVSCKCLRIGDQVSWHFLPAQLQLQWQCGIHHWSSSDYIDIHDKSTSYSLQPSTRRNNQFPTVCHPVSCHRGGKSRWSCSSIRGANRASRTRSLHRTRRGLQDSVSLWPTDYSVAARRQAAAVQLPTHEDTYLPARYTILLLFIITKSIPLSSFEAQL